MNFPLQLSFPVFSVFQQITVTDSDGATVCYVRQRILKLKEAVEVFRDKTKKVKICDIKADKVLDFTATYHFYDGKGKIFGAVARKGVRSLYKAHYEVLDLDKLDMIINEEKPLIKMIDGLIGQIPVIGFFTGLFLNPSYIITNCLTGKELVRIRKCRAFFESKFDLEKLGNFESDDEIRIIMATIMMVLLEKNRG